MDHDFSTTPDTFAADLEAQDIPAAVKTAITAAWGATNQTAPTYQVNAATGDFWTVIRIAAVLQAA
jgi:hypothetical protein